MVQRRIHNYLLIIPNMNRINPILHLDTYLLKIHSFVGHPLRLGLSRGLFPVDLSIAILNTLLPFSVLFVCFGHLNLLDLIILTILAERQRLKKVLAVKSSPLHILIHFELRILFSNVIENNIDY